MKKIIFTSLIAIISLTTFAQGKSGKNKNHNSNNEYKKDKDRDDNDRYEDRDRKDKNKNNDDRYDDQDHKDRREGDSRNNDDRYKYSKNTPRKVADSFRRDFPNASNVTWTKNTGSWTATFTNGGLIPTKRAVTYRANGQRVSSNGIFR